MEPQRKAKATGRPRKMAAKDEGPAVAKSGEETTF
jgi:hypothetical protein